MKIFVAGATGAIGRPLIAQLLTKGHNVFGLTHSQEKASYLAANGVTPIIADVLDGAAILKEVKLIQPEVIIDMLTSLPKVYNLQAMRQAAVQDRKVRLEGGSHLQKAGQSVGIKRYIVQSSAFWYAPGKDLATEKDSFAFDATPGIAAGTRTYAEIEKRVLEAKDFEGIALRFGFFYGPETWFAPDGNIADRVRQQDLYLSGGGHGKWNFVHVEDAAQGITAALTCPPGIYNLTNDTPVEMATWLPAYARWLGAPPPLERSSEEEERLNGADTLYYATQLRGASNAKAKQELGFQARPLEWLSA